jgi:DNA-binding transcriptional regulator YiaG
MHITELTDDQLQYLMEYIEVNESGHIISKKRQNKLTRINTNIQKIGITEVMVGDHKTEIGKRRGCRTPYGMSFNFTLLNKEILTCKAREIVWVFNNGVFSKDMKVAPINGDLFDDRIENLKLFPNKRNGRPIGATDNKKRKRGEGLTVKQEQQIVKMRKKSPIPSRVIAKKLGVTCNQVKRAVITAIQRGKLKPYPFTKEKMVEIDSSRDQMGVYGIFAFAKDCSMVANRLYIGSSVKIRGRVQEHLSQLERNIHDNKDMQEDYNSGQYYFKTALIEECDTEGDELEREGFHMRQYEFCSLYNHWITQDIDEIKPHLEKSKHRINPDNYTVTECGCWEWNRIHKGGYGNSIKVRIGGWGDKVAKWIKPHRLSYYKHTGEYPPLIRHMCDNSICVNPDHLESGSHSQNSSDRINKFITDFEYWWLQHKGDMKKIMEHFDFTKDTVYRWEKKLGLRDRYAFLISEREHIGLCHTLENTTKRLAKQEAKQRAIEEKEERNKYIESIREEIIKLKQRHGFSYEKLATHFNLTVSEVAKILRNIKMSRDVLESEKGVTLGLMQIVWDWEPPPFKGWEELMSAHGESILTKMIEKYPTYRTHIENMYFHYIHPDECKRICDMINSPH